MTGCANKKNNIWKVLHSEFLSLWMDKTTFYSAGKVHTGTYPLHLKIAFSIIETKIPLIHSESSLLNVCPFPYFCNSLALFFSFKSGVLFSFFFLKLFKPLKFRKRAYFGELVFSFVVEHIVCLKVLCSPRTFTMATVFYMNFWIKAVYLYSLLLCLVDFYSL